MWLVLVIVLLCSCASAQWMQTNGATWTSEVLPDSSATDSSAEIRPDFMVLGMGYSKDTYVPSFGPAAQVGVYSLELFLPVTYLPRDPYNGNQWNISWSALVPLGTAMIISVFHPQDVGPGVQKVLVYALMAPVLVANSQHHFVLVGPKGMVESAQYRLTAVVGCRTDCYSREVTWVRWTPIVGLQHALLLTGEGEEGASKWLALCGGIEAPVDFTGGPHSKPSTWFIGLKYYTRLR